MITQRRAEAMFAFAHTQQCARLMMASIARLGVWMTREQVCAGVCVCVCVCVCVYVCVLRHV
jgi:hypothetical protein